MEHQKTNKEEIQDKIYQAKTVEELLAIAVEAGETLTLEEATKLLQEVEDERAMAKDAFTSAEDLSDKELAKVAGGILMPSSDSNGPTTSTRTSPMEMTCRSGNIVKIYFSAANNKQYCAHWKCKTHGVVTLCSDNGYTVCPTCLYTGAKREDQMAKCKSCAWREKVGNHIWRDYCTSPAVRAMHGL